MSNVLLKTLAEIIKVYYSPTNAQVIVLKTVLKFTLKQLRCWHAVLRERIIRACYRYTLLK